MNNMGNVPNLNNLNAVEQNEIQKAKQGMGNAVNPGQGMTSSSNPGQGMPSGKMPGTAGNLTSSTTIKELELQQARQKVQNSGTQNTTY